MATIKDLYDAISSVDIWDATTEVFQADPDAITDLNKDQLLAGVQADGNRTPKHSFGVMSRMHVQDKLNRGRIKASTLPHMNFQDTGEFYRGFKVLFQRTDFRLYSTDSKSTELQDEYTSHIFGLTPESIKKLVSLKRDKIIGNYRQKIGL